MSLLLPRRAAIAMKSKVPSLAAGYLTSELPDRKIAPQKKLRIILRHGLGLPSSELKECFWPGYVESFRPAPPGGPR